MKFVAVLLVLMAISRPTVRGEFLRIIGDQETNTEDRDATEIQLDLEMFRHQAHSLFAVFSTITRKMQRYMLGRHMTYGVTLIEIEDKIIQELSHLNAVTRLSTTMEVEFRTRVDGASVPTPWPEKSEVMLELSRITEIIREEMNSVRLEIEEKQNTTISSLREEIDSSKRVVTAEIEELSTETSLDLESIRYNAQMAGAKHQNETISRLIALEDDLLSLNNQTRHDLKVISAKLEYLGNATTADPEGSKEFSCEVSNLTQSVASLTHRVSEFSADAERSANKSLLEPELEEILTSLEDLQEILDSKKRIAGTIGNSLDEISVEMKTIENTIRWPDIHLLSFDGSAMVTARQMGLLIYKSGTVCNDMFNDAAAGAVCRGMGFPGAQKWESGLFWPQIQNTLQIMLDDLDCRSDLWSSCSYNEGESDCDHSEDVFLWCEYETRLSIVTLEDPASAASAVPSRTGLLLFNGGTVCDRDFKNSTAEKACNLMGYDGMIDWWTDLRWVAQSSYAIQVDRPTCLSTATCPHSVHEDCSHSNDVFVTCNGPTGFVVVNEHDAIVDASTKRGLLLLNDGTVCSSGFTDTSATAVCRIMGAGTMTSRAYYASPTTALPNQGTRTTDGSTRLASIGDIACSSEEWASCSSTPNAVCAHTEDLYLYCNPTSIQSAFTLVNSAGTSLSIFVPGQEGLLLYNGYTVCDYHFSTNSAHAICKEMGYTGATSWRSSLMWTTLQSSKTIGLNFVRCSSTTWSSCTYRITTTPNCGHHEDVFLICF